MPDGTRSGTSPAAHAIRQVIVDGTAIAPLEVDLAILGAWLVGCLAISARFFPWQ